MTRRWLTKGFEVVLALMLVAMLGMVLLNVVMRYAFGTGIAATEELSRTVFVWLVFTGAVLAAYEGAHLGVDSLVVRLPPPARVACALLSESVVLAICVLVFYGTLRQHDVNASNRSLTTGMAMIWVYGVGYVASVGIGAVTLWRIVRSVRCIVDPGRAEVPPQHPAGTASTEAAL